MSASGLNVRALAVCATAVLFPLICLAQAGNHGPTRLSGNVMAAHPCADDIQRLCKAVPSGKGRKIGCLYAHRPQLQPLCHKFVDGLYANYASLAAKNHETVAQLLANAYAHQGAGLQVTVPKRTATHPQGRESQ